MSTMRPSVAIRAWSKLFTVGQTCLGIKYSTSPNAGTDPPASILILIGRCSSLGPSGCASGWPATTQFGTPRSTDNVLCPASQVIEFAEGLLMTRVKTTAAGEYPLSGGNCAREDESQYTTVPGETRHKYAELDHAGWLRAHGNVGVPEVTSSGTAIPRFFKSSASPNN